MKKHFLVIIVTFLVIPSFAFAVSTVPWLQTNLTDTFVKPGNVNGVVQGVILSASSTIGNGTQGGGLTVSGGATTTGSAYFASNALIGTTTLSATQISANDALIFGKNKGIYLNTDTSTASAEGLIKLHFLGNEAKAIIAYVDQNNDEVIWLQAHDYLSYPGNQHKHFSIEASDAAGLKQTRFSVGYGADVIDVNTNQANFYVNGADGYEIINADYDGILKMTPVDTVDIYPQSQAARALRIDDTGSTVSLSALGSTFLQVNDSIYANGNLGVGTSSMINSLEPSITLSGTLPGFYIEDTQVSESANGRLFRLVNNSGDFQIWESGRSGTATVGSSNLFNITSLGSVGIGSTTPWAQLSVNPNGITGPSFAIGSSTKTDFVVTNGGNVGIGTTSPFTKLSVNGNAYFNGNISLPKDNVIDFDSGSSNASIYGSEFIPGEVGLVFATLNDSMWITAGSKIGIGTSTPVSKLQVADDTSAIFTLTDNGASADQKHWFIESDGGRFKIGTTSDALTTGSARSMQILPSGDIGFNKIPVYAFDVGGANSLDSIGLFRVNGTYTGNASLGNNVIDLSPTMNLNAAGGSITVVRSAPAIVPTVDLTAVTNGNNNMAFGSGSNTITNATLHTGALQLQAGFSGNIANLRGYNMVGISNSGAATVTNYAAFIAGTISGATNNVGLQLCNSNIQAGTFGINTLCDVPNIMRASTTAESNYPLAMYSARAGIVSGDSLGNIGFLSNDTNITAPGALSASIGAMAAGTHTATNRLTDLVFRTTDTGGAATTEKVRITGAGRLGIGTTTPGTLLDIFSTATSTLRIDSNSATQGSCLTLKDSDGVGYTYVTANDGVLTASTISCN